MGCDASGQASQNPPPPQVDVAQVLVEPVTLRETFTGRLEAPETIDLRPRVSGYIQEVAFEEGELVDAGEVLFRIDPRPYQARAKAARAELAEARTQEQLAEQEAERARRLMEDRAISREEYDQRQAALARARARVSMAEAALETAELDLEYTQVTAPVSGRAGRALVTKGNLANADQSLLTTIVSVDPLHVYFVSNESAGLGSLSLVDPNADTEVSVTLDGIDRATRKGRLDYIDNRLDATTGTLTFRAVLPNPDGALRPGQFARVEMPVTELVRAVLVNRKAVLTDQDRRFVYVLAENNTVERRPVQPGRDVGELMVIEDGLAEGDRVVVDGTLKIYGAGMPVDPNFVAMRDEPTGSGGKAVAMNRTR
ncbi:MAG TPA: efflux RND transporter periplasmic adaptor subunit [Arenicellales bacterium]|nr:efflux RND transporter periplasmic adaptor subunit [Arenicellales bacterium]